MPGVNPLSDNQMHVQDPKLVITVPADGLAPNGARPSAVTLTAKVLQIIVIDQKPIL